MSNLYSQGNGLSTPPVYDPRVMTEDNSLETQLNKYPEINKKIMDMAPQFNVNYLLERLGRVSNKSAEKSGLGDNAYRWKQKGHYFRPAYATGDSKIDGEATTIGQLEATPPSTPLSTVDQIFSVGVKHDPVNKEIGNDFNPNDLIRFESGTTAIVLKDVVISSKKLFLLVS
jgi:hypothetical protein